MSLFLGVCTDGMLLASEAKAKLKELQQEQEDLERFQKLQQQHEVGADKS